MKKQNTIVIIIFAFLLVGTLPLSSALFPSSHTYVIQEACKLQIDSELSRMCCNEIEACVVGNILADVSIIFYLERGMKKYQISHSDLFCRTAIAEARNPTERALASGMCLHHTGSDRIAHNILIPYTIRKTAIPNYIIHPFAEQKVDNYVKRNFPQSEVFLQNSMKNADEYVDFLVRVLQPNPEYSDVNVKRLTEAFIHQVRSSDSGYDVSFTTLKAVPFYFYAVLFFILVFSLVGMFFLITRTNLNFWTVTSFLFLFLISILIISAIIMTLTGTLWKYFTMIASPISYIVPTPNSELIIQKSIDESINLMRYGIDYVKTLPPEMQDPTGIGQIRQAEADSQITRWIYILVLFGINCLWGYMVYRSRKKIKK